MFQGQHYLSLSPDLVEFLERAALAIDDVFDGFVLYERIRPCGMVQHVIVDRAQVAVDGGVILTADALCGDRGEEAFHYVQLRSAGRREMQREARMFVQTSLFLGRLVGSIFIEPRTNVAGFLHGPVDAEQVARRLPPAPLVICCEVAVLMTWMPPRGGFHAISAVRTQ